MLVAPLSGGPVEHRRFSDLPSYMGPGDLLVLNDTRVVPARLLMTRSTGGRVEALLLRRVDGTKWTTLLDSGGRLKPGERLKLEDGSDCVIGGRVEGGAWEITIPDVVDKIGRAPLPPYIKRAAGPDSTDLERYQTVYADRPGSIAAPTAGLHFTTDLLDRIARAGVEVTRVTLHVGTGTFKPVRAENVDDHAMDPERYEIPEATIRAIEKARRVIAVGTTTCRTLEAWARTGAASGETNLFIRPPFEFQVVDALLTNFHLPMSTLLMLVSAFAGRERTLEVYAEAVKERYRFFSYGDASLWI